MYVNPNDIIREDLRSEYKLSVQDVKSIHATKDGKPINLNWCYKDNQIQNKDYVNLTSILRGGSLNYDQGE